MEFYEDKPRNVEYILLAEFDITTGSTVKYQYPYPIGVDQQMLAEFMLPDGTHKRQRDWTVFFLNRPGQEGVLGDSTRANQDAGSKKDPASNQVPARIFRIDPSTQGAWQPVGTTMLNVLLDDPIRILSGTTEILRIGRTQYLGVQVMNPQYIGIQDSENTFIGMRFRTPEDADLVVAHVNHLIELREQDKEYIAQGIPPPDARRPFLYCLNCVTTRLDPTVTRGAIVKAMAICSPLHYIHEFERLLLYHLEQYFETPSISILKDLYFAINSADFGIMEPLYGYKRLIYRHSAAVAKQKTRTVPVKVGTDRFFNIHVPLSTFPNETVDFKMTDLIAKFGSQIMIIFNAILMEKRVIFLGFNVAMEELCKIVLAAACMVSPPLQDILHRVFPYTNLLYLDFTKLPSYIVGVSNPMFENRSEWWDLLCNLQTGKVTINPRSGTEIQRICTACAEVDNALYEEVDRYCKKSFGEELVRHRIQKYMQTIADISFGIITPPDAQKHAERIAEWQRTESYKAYKVHMEERLKPSLFLNPSEVYSRVNALKYSQNLSAAEVQQAFELIARNTTQPNQIDELISMLPDEDGGLLPICSGLFHPNKEVRFAAAEICSRMSNSTFGSTIFNSYGLFVDFALRNAMAETGKKDVLWDERISVARTANKSEMK